VNPLKPVALQSWVVVTEHRFFVGKAGVTLLGQTRKLSVLSRGAAPRCRRTASVSGKIGRPDEEDAGLPFPPTLLESDRQPAP
jgi:hypothetical protein